MVARIAPVVAGLLMLILAGCSGTPAFSKGTWVAEPPYREVNHPACTVRIAAQKDQRAFFSTFALTLVNKGDTALTVDWNASRYLYNGQPQGVLVFAGIDPEAVRNNDVPPETIPAGGRLERVLMPMRLIAWNPIKEKTPDSRGISPGMMPAGENGVRLSLRQAGARIALALSVAIALEK